jgi:purine-binding chemotaxis protein CheW
MGQHGQKAAEGTAATSLVFRAGSLLCALTLGEVTETLRPLAVQPLAGTPAYVRGVTILRGVPTPVVDVARLLAGEHVEPDRFLAVRTEHGPVALATGPVLGIRVAGPDAAAQHPALLGEASGRLIAGVGLIDAQPLLLLHSMRVVPDEVWAAAAGARS